MSALEIKGLYIKRCINSSVYFLLFTDVTARDNNFNKLYLIYVSCSCIAYMFYLQVSRFSFALYVLGNMY